MINLQDRTSWQEARPLRRFRDCTEKAEFSGVLTVVTLPKNTDFYLQTSTYLHLNDAKLFIEQFKEQLESAQQCGFFFPSSLKEEVLTDFTNKAMEAIHRVFFGGKETLLRKNRLDFIEIFYLLLTLKLIDFYQPDCFSFTCKDAVDIGPAMSGEMFGFLRMLNSEAPLSKAEKDFLLWTFHAPALIVRERAMDAQRFNRALSLLSLVSGEIDADRKEITKELARLFNRPFFNGLELK